MQMGNVLVAGDWYHRIFVLQHFQLLLQVIATGLCDDMPTWSVPIASP